ncbi:uncharacterized protein LOC118458858 [Anopheles albimanus]|uniref:Selenoprotein P N-terminal domain-containing protein n=1 Tax=Anopheles albimanus TaxID=7167 RepID=A0A8W7K994_ANOAL|nr:uncharacterized protein LOC118458858 [Anopheles albimanus]
MELWPVVFRILVLVVHCIGVIAGQEMTITEELETCSLLDQGKLDVLFDGAADEFLGKVTVLYNLAPPKPEQTQRIFANRDPIHYHKIDYREQIDLYYNLFQRFHSQQLYRNDVRFLLAASLHRVPYELEQYNFTEFFATVRGLADERNLTVYPNPLTENGTFALLGLREFQVYVIDRCSRVSYIIEPPWSLIQFSYVKAAVLSTFYDRPCGKCEFENYLNSTISDEDRDPNPTAKVASANTGCNGHGPCTEVSEESTENAEEDEGGMQDSEEEDEDSYTGTKEDGDPFANLTVTGPELVLPLRVILPVMHIHVETASEESEEANDNRTEAAKYRLYHYVVFRWNDTSNHRDHPNDQVEDVELEEVSLVKNAIPDAVPESNDTESNQIRVGGTEWPIGQLREILNTSSILYQPQQQRVFERLRRYNLTAQQQYDEVAEVSVANRYAAWLRRRTPAKPEQQRNNRRSQLKRHYARLLPWLNWTFGKALPPGSGANVKVRN